MERAATSTQDLLEAAIALVAERGVEGFTVANVAERAGVHRRLPVHRFKTRDALLLEVAKVVARPCGSPPMTGLSPLLGWYKAALRAAQDPSLELRAFAALLTAKVLPRAVEKHVGAFLEIETEIARRHLEAGLAAGAIDRSLDLRAHAKVLAAAMAGEIAQAVRSGVSDAQVDDVIEIISAALRTDVAHPLAARATP